MRGGDGMSEELNRLHSMMSVGAVLNHKNRKKEEKPKKEWMSPRPKQCDVCSCELEEQFSFIDGRTQFGPWGIMCPMCHEAVGCGLGLGKGQCYNWLTLEKIDG